MNDRVVKIWGKKVISHFQGQSRIMARLGEGILVSGAKSHKT